MLSKIKNFFHKEVSNDENLLVISAKDWVTEFRSIFDNFSSESQLRLINDINNKVNELRMLGNNLINLEFNPQNMDKRLSELIDDSRVSYVNHIKTLCEELIIKDKINLNYAVEKFNKRMNEFAGVTHKSHFTLKDNFYPQISTISENIKVLNLLFKELNQNINSGAGKEFEDIKNRTHHYYLDIRLENKLKSELESLKEEVNLAKNDIIDLEKRRESFKSSGGFDYIRDEYNKRDDELTKVEKLKNDVYEFFLNFNEFLVELKTFSNQKLAHTYASDPISTLINDEKFEIIKILEEIKLALKEKSIIIDYKKKQKLCFLIEKTIKSPPFSKWVLDYKEMQKSIKELDSIIKKSPSMTNISEVDYKIIHSKEKLSKKSDLISVYEQKLLNLDLKKRKLDLEKDLMNLTKKKVLII